jgi:hypothetical protein
VFGAVLASRLTTHITEQFAHAPAAVAGNAAGVNVDANDIQAIARLAAPVRALVLRAFADALDDVFLVGVPFVLVALVTALFLKEIPLRSRGDGPSAPGSSGSSGPSAPSGGGDPVLADAH